MEGPLRYVLLLGLLIYLGIIFYLLKAKKLSVKYTIIWLISGASMFVLALFPYVVLVLGDISGVVNPVNFIFIAGFAFVLLILLSLAAAVSDLSDRTKRLAQQVALLESRIRSLERPAGKADQTCNGG